MIDHANVKRHYESDNLAGRLLAELENAGLELGPLNWHELAPFDHFHVGGLPASKTMAHGLQLKSGDSVLDVGAGVGGPARYIAATYGCRVVGIDLSQAFVEAATMLSERTELADKATFVQGDALDLPFEPSSFDHALTQHVAMNIADRSGFYANIYRVLKPGGRLAIYDVVEGNGDPLVFPVPWARTDATSFLLTSDAMRGVLIDTGFVEISMEDKTQAGLDWFEDILASRLSSPQPNRLNLSLVVGPDFPEMARNVAINLREGKASIVQAIYARPGNA